MTTKHMDLNEFQNEGYLQEVNRRFFHPLGLALAIEKNVSDGKAIGLLVFDYRDDEEGVIFSDEYPAEVKKAENIKKKYIDTSFRRLSAFGYVIQPVNEKRD